MQNYQPITEAEILKAIMTETQEYRTNFHGIDILIRLEKDYYAAKCRDYDEFYGCPNSYDILENANLMCEGNEDEYDCTQCWKNAVEAKIRGEI